MFDVKVLKALPWDRLDIEVLTGQRRATNITVPKANMTQLVPLLQ
jgi:hypothetical protein